MDECKEKSFSIFHPNTSPGGRLQRNAAASVWWSVIKAA
jgi:hypothetical protein